MTENPHNYRGFHPSDSAELDRETTIAIVGSLAVGVITAVGLLLTLRFFA